MFLLVPARRKPVLRTWAGTYFILAITVKPLVQILSACVGFCENVWDFCEKWKEQPEGLGSESPKSAQYCREDITSLRSASLPTVHTQSKIHSILLVFRRLVFAALPGGPHERSHWLEAREHLQPAGHG